MKQGCMQFHFVRVLGAAAVLAGTTQVQAEDVFVLSGPVSWAGTQDQSTGAYSSYTDGSYQAVVHHDSSAPISVSGSWGGTAQAQWSNAISSIEFTVFDPSGNVRFTDVVYPDPNPSGSSGGYNASLNRVMKYAFDMPGWRSRQQYWDISYGPANSSDYNYAQAAYVDHSVSATDYADFLANIMVYPDPEGGNGWGMTQFSGYAAKNQFMRAVWGSISNTVARRDSDGDGINDNNDACPASIMSATVTIGSTTTNVANTLLPSGCTLSDLIAIGLQLDGVHGTKVSKVAHILNGLKDQGIISGKEKGTLQSATAKKK